MSSFDTHYIYGYVLPIEKFSMDLRSVLEGRIAILTWQKGWKDPHRRHSTLGYLSAINYERKMLSRVV